MPQAGMRTFTTGFKEKHGAPIKGTAYALPSRGSAPGGHPGAPLPRSRAARVRGYIGGTLSGGAFPLARAAWHIYIVLSY